MSIVQRSIFMRLKTTFYTLSPLHAQPRSVENGFLSQFFRNRLFHNGVHGLLQQETNGDEPTAALTPTSKKLLEKETRESLDNLRKTMTALTPVITKRGRKWNSSKIALVRCDEDEESSVSRHGSRERNKNQKRRMKQKQIFRESEAAKRKAQCQAAVAKREAERRERWKKGAERAKQWKEFLAKLKEEGKSKRGPAVQESQ